MYVSFDYELCLMRKFHNFLTKYLRYSPKLSSYEVKLKKSASCDSDLLSAYVSNIDTTNYNKRYNSLDITRNSDDNYEVVLSYQRITKPKSNNSKIMNIISNNYDILDTEIALEEIDKADLNVVRVSNSQASLKNALDIP